MSRYGRDGDCRVLLKRDNFNVPWGFRLQGGVDLGAPLTVQRVFSGSPADSQLQRGDVVLAIDDRDVTTCNLNQIQELIKSAGSSLSVGVRRGRDGVNDTSILNQTISFQQQPSFVTKNISSPSDYAIPVQNQYQDSQRAAVSSTTFYPSNQASSPSRQIPVYHASTQEQVAPVVRQAMVHQANVSQTPVHQTQSRQAPPMTNQQAGYSSQDFNQNFQPAPRVSNVDDRKSFNVQQPAASVRVQQSPIRSQVPQFSSQQDRPARYGPQDDLPNYGYSDEHLQQQQFHPQQRQQQQQQGQQQQQLQQQQQRSQFGSNDQTLSQQEQAEEDEEQFKSIQEIKQMFNKPDPANAPVPRPKGVTNQPRGPMSGRKTSPYPPKSTYNPLEFVGTNERAGSALSKAPPTSVRKTPPYQQKSSYNPLDFVGVTGKPKEAPSKPPGSIQRGPPPEQAPSMSPRAPQQEVDPMMDFYLHGFDSKHGGPPPNLKLNGVSHDQPGPKPGGYGGHLLPPRTTPALAKAAPAKKKEFNPAQSSVYLALLEEEERAKSGGQAEQEPPSSPAPRQAQYQQQQQKPRKPMGGQSSASRLQELLERDQAQLAPYQEEDARPQQTNQQMNHQQMSHQQMNQQMSHQPMNQQMSRQQMSHQPMNQQMSHQQMSQPTYTSNQQFKPSSPQRMDYQSSPLPYSTQNKSFSPHQAPYHAPTAYSNEGDYYGRSDGGRSDGYGAGYPVTDF